MFQLPLPLLESLLTENSRRTFLRNEKKITALGEEIGELLKDKYLEDDSKKMDARDLVAAIYFLALFFTDAIANRILEKAPDDIKAGLALLNLMSVDSSGSEGC